MLALTCPEFNKSAVAAKPKLEEQFKFTFSSIGGADTSGARRLEEGGNSFGLVPIAKVLEKNNIIREVD